jgi:hypothetical protein
MLPIEMAVAFSLIGLGGVVAAGTGVLLPAGERLTALLALVAGGGVGVIALAIGGAIVEENGYETVWLVASILGFAVTVATAMLLLASSRRESRAPISGPAAS